MKSYLTQLYFLFVGVLFFSNTLIAQQERITNYEVIVEVNKDRSIKVKEEISVIAAGKIIKRGLTRGLPKKRTFVNGKTKYIRYNITKVLRDGKPEKYHTKKSKGEEMLYLGRKNTILKPGNYKYTIEYTVPHQIEQLEEIDEIYWNAIGTEVVFPIDKASCLVRLPKEGRSLQQSCYTGTSGSKESACENIEWRNPNERYFQTNRPLRPREGFTIGVGFEKGIVEAPSMFERYGSAMVLGSMSFGLLLYFVTTWNRYGIDPPKPTPYPLFASPQGYSPSSISYISKEKYDSNKITASIIDLAVKGHLRIEGIAKDGVFKKKNNYRLIRLEKSEEDLFTEEKALLDNLFRGQKEVVIDGTYESRIESAYNNHKYSILGQHENFVKKGNNQQFMVLPIIASFLAIIAAVFMMNQTGTAMDGIGRALFTVVLISLPVIILGVLFYNKKSIPSSMVGLIVPLLFMFVFVGGASATMGLSELKGFVFSAFNGANLNLVTLVLFIPLAIIALVMYSYLIKRPTEEKLKLQSEIEGFKMYLEMAEKDRINLLNPPDRTPEHFEAMLPYAFALGIEHKWSALFESILAAAAYNPVWTNDRGVYTHTYFATDFGRSMSNSATPPTPENTGGGGFGGGSGGGGFSGGGGGGGSVGGW